LKIFSKFDHISLSVRFSHTFVFIFQKNDLNFIFNFRF